jgi:START domain
MLKPFAVKPVATCTALVLGIAAWSATAIATDANHAEWALQQDDGRIKVYTRPVADSPFLEVKATALINAPIADIASRMGDGSSCVEWRVMCKSSEILRVDSDTERYVYMVLDMPWPVADRDMVIHSIIEIDTTANTVTVQLQNAASKHPEQDYIRAISNGQYLMQALGDEQVEFTYIMHTDLGGDLPADLINPRVVESAYADIKQLQLLAEK